MSKYGNRKYQIDGHVFDSMREARRYQELKYLEKAGLISNLELQVPFELIPAITHPKTGKTIQRAIKYIADFVYQEDGETVVEDSKGYRTEVYRLKKKLFRWCYGLEIKEV